MWLNVAHNMAERRLDAVAVEREFFQVSRETCWSIFFGAGFYGNIGGNGEACQLWAARKKPNDYRACRRRGFMLVE